MTQSSHYGKDFVLTKNIFYLICKWIHTHTQFLYQPVSSVFAFSLLLSVHICTHKPLTWTHQTTGLTMWRAILLHKCPCIIDFWSSVTRLGRSLGTFLTFCIWDKQHFSGATVCLVATRTSAYLSDNPTRPSHALIARDQIHICTAHSDSKFAKLWPFQL